MECIALVLRPGKNDLPQMGVGGRPPRVFGLMNIVNTSENRRRECKMGFDHGELSKLPLKSDLIMNSKIDWQPMKGG